ncbi:IclR family transcriptional regulator [Salinicola rhizosphaerae]|uniref:Transcriptional regulator n=1 Tax=Salinicola rhizosphaerae TaxID=1443141 RepID=A0ABQ3DVY9_9GAMM|nr:IclR family transcriptional regulator [Salinicola rhizosphaerae]GHB14854.1 transcriptional regulator [Salinicola rhizosphaerae]
MSETGGNDSGGKQVVARAAAILNALESEPRGMSLGRIAKATDLPRTTVHRLVVSLEAQQLVASGSEGIRLGPALARLAAAAHVDVADIARPFVESLGRRTRETVDLSVYRGRHAVSVDQFASDQELRVVSPVGTAFPIHCTAHGKALLAALSVTEAERVLNESPLEARTPASVTDATALMRQLATIRQGGVAVDREEHAEGVCGLGIVLNTGATERYALSLAVPSQRFARQQEKLEAALRQCAAEIESKLGMT